MNLTHKKPKTYSKHQKHESLCLRKTFGHCWNSSIMQWQVPGWVAELKSLRRYKHLQATAWILLGHLTGLGVQDRSCFCIRETPKESVVPLISPRSSPTTRPQNYLLDLLWETVIVPNLPVQRDTRAWSDSPAQKETPEFPSPFTIYLQSFKTSFATVLLYVNADISHININTY